MFLAMKLISNKMKVLLLALMVLPFLGFSQNSLVIEVVGVSNSKGNIQAALYNTADTFLSNDVVFKTDSVLARQGTTKLVMEDIPDGEYAVAIFHDENGNDELDTNWLGIPKEPIGFSKSGMKTFGPPKFKDCSFRIQPDTQIQISL